MNQHLSAVGGSAPRAWPSPVPFGARPLFAVVELSAGTAPDLRARLVEAAYRASRAGEVLLLLHGVERDAVDRILDGVVPAVGVQVHGVRYADGSGEGVDTLVLTARVVVAVSSSMRARLARLGLPCTTPLDACGLWSEERPDMIEGEGALRIPGPAVTARR